MSREAFERIDDSLRSLTDFQIATVAAACRQLNGPNGLRGRVLVADEVGLGKTLVARGVVGMLLRERLERQSQFKPVERPLRVAYICSNLALARENAGKLAIFRGEDAKYWVSTPTFGRMAELGLIQPPVKAGVLLELCSLTPATSFSLTHGAGTARERYIIWRAVAEAPYVDDAAQLESFFSMGVTASWGTACTYFNDRAGLEPTALRTFHQGLGQTPDLDDRALKAATTLALSLRSWRTLLKGVSELRPKQTPNQDHLESQVRRRVREMFVEACARNLRADLFILDEFQRFGDLVKLPSKADDDDEGNSKQKISEEQVIARRVLHEGEGYGTLLLSATPFKALTHLGEEEEGKAHARELAWLLAYLSNGDPTVAQKYEAVRQALLTQILELPAGPLQSDRLPSGAKSAVEAVLRTYICRTERSGIEPDIERIFRNAKLNPPCPSVAEVEEFVILDQLSEALKQVAEGSAGTDVMKLHKAAPWCLSFLGGYTLRVNLQKFRDTPAVAAALRRSSPAWIPYERLQNFQIDMHKDAPSARFRQVLEAAAPAGAERLLWIPPSLPNYPGEGPFKGSERFSKSLLFSSLVLAPRALSSYVSYECERRLLPKKGRRHNYFEHREELSQMFRFETKSLSTAWSLAYPSRRLRKVRLPWPADSLEQTRKQVMAELADELELVVKTYGSSGGRKGSRWYTLAPFLLDWISTEGRTYVGQWADAMRYTSTSVETRKAQVGRIMATLHQGPLALGEPPKDLLPFLADLAIAGAGVCMSRSLCISWDITPDSTGADKALLLSSATDAGLSFVDKMNRIESQRVLVAVCKGDKPWQAVARYSATGNLQAVFDEYVHLLKSIHGTLADAVAAFQVAVGTGAVTVTAQAHLPPPTRVNAHDAVFHCHYAVPLGNQKGTDEKGIDRITNVRAAFNSPFWPFMLNSTSIGQEGLDFHWYCRRIIHWSLPSNPIDLEQREGRINRYKSLVVRQRTADAYGQGLGFPRPDNVWDALFGAAMKQTRRTDLVPYWHSPAGSACIERVVPAMPFSIEVSRLDEILRILALYRLAFGQPRQQELLENLLKRDYSDSDLTEIRRALFIDLAPFNYMERV